MPCAVPMLLFFQALLALPAKKHTGPPSNQMLSNYKSMLLVVEQREKLKQIDRINSGPAEHRRTGYYRMATSRNEFIDLIIRWMVLGVSGCIVLVVLKILLYVLFGG